MTVLPLTSPTPIPSSAPAPAGVPTPRPAATGAPSGYRVSLATCQDDVRAAQRLRHIVFAGELGARLDSTEPGLDSDAFDAYCDHLLVREAATGEVVATYRLLPPQGARLAAWALRRGRVRPPTPRPHPRRPRRGREVLRPPRPPGRSRHRPDLGWPRPLHGAHRPHLAGRLLLRTARRRGALAARSWDTVRAHHLAPEEYWVTPHRLWDTTGHPGGGAGGRAGLPPLLRGYLRLGAWVCGAPAHDPDFDVADLYVLLSMQRTDPRYLRHFLSLAPLR